MLRLLAMLSSRKLLILVWVLVAHMHVSYSQAILSASSGNSIKSGINATNAVLADCGDYITSYKIEQDVCNPKMVHFTNLNNAATAVSWDFGDGSSGSSNSADHEYSKYDIYTVKMVVTYPGGCSNEVTKLIPVFLTKDDQLIQSANKTICLGDEVQLNTLSSNQAFCWLPANGLTDEKNKNPIVKPDVTTTYQFNSQLITANLVKNAGFEAGNVDFFSSYEYRTDQNRFEGKYVVTDNPLNLNPNFSTCGDHTSGTGKMMVVNGSYTPGEVVWSQVVPVKPNTVYSFGTWIQSVNYPAPARLLFRINGVVLGNDINAGANPCEWSEFSTLWNSVSATSATIEIINNNTIQGGNDFALDDITFSTTSIYYDEVTITVENPPVIDAGQDVEICAGSAVQLAASGGVSYSWSPAQGLSNPSINNPMASPAATTTYTVTGSTAGGCSATDDILVTVNPVPQIDIGTNQVAICEGKSYTIPGTVQGASSLAWTPAAGLSDATIANPVAQPTVPTTYELMATSDKQCVAKASVTIGFASTTPVEAGPDVTLCSGTNTQLNASGANTYQWTPATGLSDATIANPTASPAATTKYLVKGISAAGCETLDSMVVTVQESPTADIGSDASICSGKSYPVPGVATNAATISWSPTAGLSDPSIISPIASPSVTTTYTVTVTNGQCEIKKSITITVAPTLQINTIEDLSLCENGTVVLNTNAVSGGIYQWSPATGLSDPTIANPVASPAQSTKYVVSVINSDGCEGKDSVNITVVPQPTISVGNDAAICEGNSYQIPGVATDATTISWSPATGLSDASVANPVASPAATTTYIVTATNGICEAKDTITITVAPSLQIQTINDTTICGSNGITLNTTAVSGGTYQWTPAAGLSDASIASPVATPAQPTTYTVSVTTPDGCSGKDSVRVALLKQPAISVGNDAAICTGNSYQVPGIATDATTISWSPATGLSDASVANPVASPAATTTYIVTATNGICEAKDTITITVAPSLQIQTINDTTICGSNGITLNTTAVSGGTYQWTPAAGLSDASIASPVATPAQPTTYTVSVTTPDGCSGKDSVRVALLKQPIISVGNDAAICTGNSYQIPGIATDATTINWSPATGLSDASVANPVASPAATTTYIVTATNGICEAKDTITITVAPSLQIQTINDTTICGSNGITLNTTAVSGGTYQWTPAAGLSDASIASPVATPAQPTTYTVSVTTPDGCSGKDSVRVALLKQPTISVGNDAAICTGNSYQIPGIATDATTISWSPATGLSDASVANPVASPAATTTYIVTATNGICEAKDTITITVAPSLQIQTINDTTICGSNGITLNTTAVSGGTYQWTPAAGLSDAGIASPVATPAQPTTYTVSVTTPDGCSGKDSVKVAIIPQPTVNAGADVAVCSGNGYQIPGVTTNATRISWSPVAGLSDPAIINPVVTATNATTYIVTASNGQCVARDTVSVALSTSIRVTPINDTSICAGNAVPLGSTFIPGAKYTWSPATGLSDPNAPDPIASPTTTTNYILMVESEDGCKGSDSVLVTVSANPVVTMSNDITVCEGHQTTLVAQSQGAKQFQWSPSAGLSDPRNSQPVATVNATTTYNVIVTNASGCTGTGAVTVTSAPLPLVGLTKSSDIDCAHSSVQLKATGGDSYSWSPATGLDNANTGNPLAKPSSNTTYTVTASTSQGCTADASITVNVKADPVDEFYLPTAFTPNGDGLNDCFGLRKANLTSPFQFEVYNRWGQLVFATSSTSNCWDGTYNGVPQPGDAFVWQIKVKNECGDIYKKGTVVLVR